jgi:hypothetical protein
MAFGDFKYPDVLAQFGLNFNSTEDLFPGVAPCAPTGVLNEQLKMTAGLAATINTEKARSEWMVAPVLADFWSRYHGQIGLYSGVAFNADPDAGLNGFCDYLISRSPQQMVIAPPVLVAFEAKNESIMGGLGQCIAAMVGAQRFNRRQNAPSDPIYGCVTSGTAWRFLKLSNQTVTLGINEYLISQTDQLLGILMHIVGPPPVSVAA